MRESEELLATARRCGIPVIHTQIRYHPQHQRDGGIWVKKAPVMRDMVEGNPLSAFCPEVLPFPEEVVITKQYASAFFGTALASLLVTEGIDTLIIAGCSTSGCVRASAVDALQYGYRAMVVRECVGDRHAARMKPTCLISTVSMAMWCPKPQRWNIWDSSAPAKGAYSPAQSTHKEQVSLHSEAYNTCPSGFIALGENHDCCYNPSCCTGRQGHCRDLP
nr:isochorismatase family protein [Tatumella ptyseos]